MQYATKTTQFNNKMEYNTQVPKHPSRLKAAAHYAIRHATFRDVAATFRYKQWKKLVRISFFVECRGVIAEYRAPNGIVCHWLPLV